MDFQVEVKGVDKLKTKLTNIDKGFSNLNLAMVKIGRELTKFYSVAPFASRGQAIGESWEPLNPAYKRWKERKYPGKSILVLTGGMQGSFKFTPGLNEVTISNSSDHFQKHQTGQGVPKRVMLKVAETPRRQAERILKKEITRMIKAA